MTEKRPLSFDRSLKHKTTNYPVPSGIKQSREDSYICHMKSLMFETIEDWQIYDNPNFIYQLNKLKFSMFPKRGDPIRRSGQTETPMMILRRTFPFLQQTKLNSEELCLKS